VPVNGEALAPLPRGRHKLSAEDVSASQRARLLRAMAACVGEDGYTATTVPRVVARARVSRNAFYELFADKTECFVAMLNDHTDELLAQLTALGSERDWITALRIGVRRYLDWWQGEPHYCRAFFVELPAAGPRALDARDSAFARFEAMFVAMAAWARHADPSLPPLRGREPALVVYAITELIAQEWRAGRGDQLAGLHDEILAYAVRMLADDETAARALG
jgi:AcrR family transcriptional regulator